jgi:hypothetical protein
VASIVATPLLALLAVALGVATTRTLVPERGAR